MPTCIGSMGVRCRSKNLNTTSLAVNYFYQLGVKSRLLFASWYVRESFMCADTVYNVGVTTLLSIDFPRSFKRLQPLGVYKLVPVSAGFESLLAARYDEWVDWLPVPPLIDTHSLFTRLKPDPALRFRFEVQYAFHSHLMKLCCKEAEPG